MEFAMGNIFARTESHMAEGVVVEGHTHNFDHVTFVTMGSFEVTRHNLNGTTDVVTVDAGMPPILIKAECEHTLVALKDNSKYYCIYAHRLPQADGTDVVVQTYSGWENAYV